MKKYILIFGLFLIAQNVIANDKDFLINRQFMKLMTSEYIFRAYNKSECGHFVEGNSEPVEYMHKSIEELKNQLSETQKENLQNELGPNNEAVANEGNRWFKRNLNHFKKTIKNKDFMCGVTFGSLISILQRFEQKRIKLHLKINSK